VEVVLVGARDHAAASRSASSTKTGALLKSTAPSEPGSAPRSGRISSGWAGRRVTAPVAVCSLASLRSSSPRTTASTGASPATYTRVLSCMAPGRRWGDWASASMVRTRGGEAAGGVQPGAGLGRGGRPRLRAVSVLAA